MFVYTLHDIMDVIAVIVLVVSLIILLVLSKAVYLIGKIGRKLMTRIWGYDGSEEDDGSD